MGCGAGVGCGQPSEPGDIAGQFDDALVVDVVQHKIGVPGYGLGDGGLPPYIWTERAEIQSGRFSAVVRKKSSFGCRGVSIVGLRRPAASRPVCPVTLRPDLRAGRTELTWTR